MAIFVGVGRTDECSNSKKEEKEKKWKLLSEIKLTANNPKILIKQDAEGNEFSCERIIIIGKIVSKETRQKLSKAMSGKIVSTETKLLLRKINLGKKLTQETRDKMSKALKGRIDAVAIDRPIQLKGKTDSIDIFLLKGLIEST